MHNVEKVVFKKMQCLCYRKHEHVHNRKQAADIRCKSFFISYDNKCIWRRCQWQFLHQDKDPFLDLLLYTTRKLDIKEEKITNHLHFRILLLKRGREETRCMNVFRQYNKRNVEYHKNLGIELTAWF